MPFEVPDENEETNDEAEAQSISDPGGLTAANTPSTGGVQDEGTGPTIGQRIMQIGRQPWQQAGNVEQFFGGRPRFSPKTVVENSGLGGENAADGTEGTTNSPFTVDRRRLPMFRPKFGQATAQTQTNLENNPIPERRLSGDFDDLRTLSEEASRSPQPGVAASVRRARNSRRNARDGKRNCSTRPK